MRWSVADDAGVVTVNIVDDEAPEGVTVDGEKLHDAPVGSPEQLNKTVELNPFCGVIKMVVVPLCPAATLSEAGDATMEKSGPEAIIAYASLTMGLLAYPLPTAIASTVSDDETVIGPAYTDEVEVGAIPLMV